MSNENKTLGQMTPAEQKAAIARAAKRMQAELVASADAIAEALALKCAVCGGELEPSSYGGFIHTDDTDDTHTPELAR